MKFVHNFKPEIELKRFDLRVPGMGWGFRNVRILEGGNEIYKTEVISINNKIKFKLPKDVVLQIGTIYTMELEKKNVQGT